MAVVTSNITVDTKGEVDIINITAEVSDNIKSSGIKNGTVTVFIPGATGAVTTIEYEPGLVSDFKKLMERVAPKNGQEYQHNVTHSDRNAHSHLRASLIGPGLTVPIVDSELVLGVWQQIVFVDMDNRERKRQIVTQIIGEK
ncbi:MAG: secondary thiamine-phosphate synthase enzyme YjbQ [Elusimicrobiota bacterium]